MYKKLFPNSEDKPLQSKALSEEIIKQVVKMPTRFSPMILIPKVEIIKPDVEHSSIAQMGMAVMQQM